MYEFVTGFLLGGFIAVVVLVLGHLLIGVYEDD